MVDLARGWRFLELGKSVGGGELFTGSNLEGSASE